MKRIVFFFALMFAFASAQAQNAENLDSIINDHYSNAMIAKAMGDTTKMISEYQETVAWIEKEDKPEQDIRYENVLNELVEFYSSVLDYNNTVISQRKVCEITRKTFGEKSENYATSLAWLANYYANLGNYNEAIKYGTQALNIYKDALGEKHPDYATSLSNLAAYYADLGKFSEAINYGTQALNIRKEVLGEKHSSYANSMHNLATYYDDLGKYNEAINYGTQALNICKEVLGEKHPSYAISLSGLATYYDHLGNYSEAINYATQALNIRKEVLGEKHPSYANSLSNLASYYDDLGNYSEAINLGTKALNIFKEVLGEKHPSYANSLSGLATYYDHLGKYSEAIKYGTQALSIRKEVLGEKHPSYALSLDNLASYYADLGNYNEAINLGTQDLNITKEVLGEKHPYYATSLGNLANYYDHLGNYSEAINLGTQVMNILKEVLGEKHPDYATSLGNLATYYAHLGNYSEAINYGTQAMNIFKEVLGEKHPDFALSLCNLAGYYANLGNYNEAINLGTQAMNIFKEVLGEKHPNSALSLNNLAGYYAHLGNYNEAINYGTQTLNIRKEVLGEKHPDYATSLNNLAGYYSYLGNYSEAIKLDTEALNIRKEVLGEKHPDYATSLGNLALYYAHFGKYGEAINYGTLAMNIFKEVLGEKHPYYATSLGNLADYYDDLGNYSEAIKLRCDFLNLAQDIVLNTFGDLSCNERQLFWEKYNYGFNSYFPQIAYKSGFSNVSSSLYDKSALFAKGLLLGAETEMTKLIQEGGDAEALAKYEQLRMNRMMLNKLYEKPIAERQMNTDSLENLVNAQEKELVEKCKVYGDYTKNLRLTWKDVQQHLGEQDLAVEFLSFPVGNDSTMYIALTLCKNDTAPQMVTLFEQKELSALPDTTTFNCPEMTALVWGKMQEQLKGIKSIYFAAAGQLHNIGIEYLPGMEDYNIYRLSSTRELVNRETNNNPQNAVVYGNINYNSDISKNTPVVANDDTPITKGMPDFGKNKTKQSLIALGDAELKSVTATLKSAKVPYSVFSEDAATEESFKALSGKKTKTLHIDTHGFYYSEKEENDDILKRFGNEKASAEDKSLKRCGLYFAGASMFLDGDTIPEGVDDGVLTGQEIAQLDLRGLDLVVMSACQTGLGDISQGEGVFGLQRGFKKAGAQSLLMSLWSVDAEATQILMSEFYKQYTSGKTKRAAFQAAQQYLKTVQNGKYNQPKYWAAFILLDAIN